MHVHMCVSQLIACMYTHVFSTFNYVHVCMCTYICATVHVWKSEDNLQKSALPTITWQWVTRIKLGPSDCTPGISVPILQFHSESIPSQSLSLGTPGSSNHFFWWPGQLEGTLVTACPVTFISPDRWPWSPSSRPFKHAFLGSSAIYCQRELPCTDVSSGFGRRLIPAHSVRAGSCLLFNVAQEEVWSH